MATYEEILAPYLNNQSNYGKLQQAYALLNQPGGPEYEQVNRGRAAGGTENLARAFMQEYQSKYGKMPSESEVSQFVNSSFSPEYAKNIALSGTSDISTASPLVTSFLEKQGQDKQYEDIQKGLGAFDIGEARGALGDIFGSEQQLATGAINDIFNKQKGSLVEEAAASGLLRSPAGFANVANLESNRARALSDATAQIFGKRGTARQGLEEFGADYGLRRGGLSANILGGQRTGNLAQDQFNYGRESNERQSALDEIFRNAGMAEAIRRRKDQFPQEDTMSKISRGVDLANKIGGFGKENEGGGLSGIGGWGSGLMKKFGGGGGEGGEADLAKMAMLFGG